MMNDKINPYNETFSSKRNEVSILVRANTDKL